MVLKANDRRTSSPCHDEFRGPRSDCVRQVASDNNNNNNNMTPIYSRSQMLYGQQTFDRRSPCIIQLTDRAITEEIPGRVQNLDTTQIQGAGISL
ncbi:hypothetical protein TNCV_3356741 [Trichonephila clavipes]|nr:hypothetical protein TNCV_3356741 [Trichonephila clavipes]